MRFVSNIFAPYSRKFAVVGFAAMLGVSALTGLNSAHAEELRIGLAAEPSSIDPHFQNLAPNAALALHIFEPLIFMDERQQVRPGLAESWSRKDDRTWQFKLRENVRFHDGSPFTAQDVIFTFARIPQVRTSAAAYLPYTKGKTLTALSPHLLQISTEQPEPLMLNELAQVMILSSKLSPNVQHEEFSSGAAAIGTGPFKFASFTPGDRAVLNRNDNYWGKKPDWSRVVMRFIRSDPTRVAALMAGDVEVIEGVPPSDIPKLKATQGISTASAPSNRSIFLQLDQDRDDTPFVRGKDGGIIANPFKKREVREALSLAINRRAMTERLMDGAALPAAQLLPDGYFGTARNLVPTPHDPDKARALLAQAGYPNGFRLTIHGPNGRYTNDAKIIEAVAQMFTRIGIETHVETMVPATFFTRAAAQKPEFSMVLSGWGAGTGENSSPLKSLLMTYNRDKGTGGANRGRYSNPAFDRVMEQALTTVDDVKRFELLAEATTIAMKDVAMIPIHYQINSWASRNRIGVRARSDEYTMAMSMWLK